MMRFAALFLTLLVTLPAMAATSLTPGGLSEYNVQLPDDLRKMAGRGQVSPVTRALVSIGVPSNIDMAHEWPVLIISATSDPEYNSSRLLLRAYAEVALENGWIVLAVDPAEKITVEQDDVAMRLALNTAALAALKQQWPGTGTSPLAFGGFSGGAKYSSWMAAAFASQGRNVIGIYLAGINQDTLIPAAQTFNVMNATFRRTPIYIQSAENDEVATPAAHRDVVSELASMGFKNVRMEVFPGGHTVEPVPLKSALQWFRQFASVSAGAK